MVCEETLQADETDNEDETTNATTPDITDDTEGSRQEITDDVVQGIVKQKVRNDELYLLNQQEVQSDTERHLRNMVIMSFLEYREEHSTRSFMLSVLSHFLMSSRMLIKMSQKR